MNDAEFAALPATLMARELRFRVRQRGRRTRVLTLVPALLDQARYLAATLAALYARRWQAETDLRHLKQTLGLDVLRCQTMPGVVKELTAFVIVYNLVRRVMRPASRESSGRGSASRAPCAGCGRHGPARGCRG